MKIAKNTVRGENSRDMKSANRLLFLRLLCTEGPLVRGEIANRTGLSKMTVSNIITDLVAAGLLREEVDTEGKNGAGRKPGLLSLASDSPTVVGMHIGRKSCHVLISDLSAQVLLEQERDYPAHLTGDRLVALLLRTLKELRKDYDRPIVCVGISALGPLDNRSGILLAPPNFYGIRNFPLRSRLEDALGIPCLLSHDISAAAQAELLYGAGRELGDFLHLHFGNGIGAGIVAQGKLFDGVMGLSGELGHTSIDFRGPLCDCGNRGCLELYANAQNLTADYAQARMDAGLPATRQVLSLPEILALAHREDPGALYALDRFCEYVSAALVNCLNLIDTHCVLLSHKGQPSSLMESMLQEKVNERLLAASCRRVTVRPSTFQFRAPAMGAIAVAAEAIFSGQIPILPAPATSGAAEPQPCRADCPNCIQKL